MARSLQARNHARPTALAAAVLQVNDGPARIVALVSYIAS
jgi:hypothetical protein